MALAARALIADAHLDLLLELAHRRGERRAFERLWLPQLRAGAVGLQVCPLFAALEEREERALVVALEQVAVFRRALAESAGQVAHVRTWSDLETLDGRIGLVLALEGCEPLAATTDLADVFWELGVRMVSLTWNAPNAFAAGAAAGPEQGLTAAGRELVDHLAGIGALLDLAHASRATFREVLDRAPNAAVLVSHAGCRALVETPRNVDDDQLRALAERGGLFCVMAHPFVIDPEGRSLERLVDHVDHAVRVAGIEHVGLGGDFTRQIDRVTGPPQTDLLLLPPGAQLGDAIEGLEGPQDYGRLVDALRRRGYDGERLEAVLSENLLSFLRRALPAG